MFTNVSAVQLAASNNVTSLAEVRCMHGTIVTGPSGYYLFPGGAALVASLHVFAHDHHRQFLLHRWIFG